MSSRRISNILLTAAAIALLLVLPAFTIGRSFFEQYWQVNHSAQGAK